MIEERKSNQGIKPFPQRQLISLEDCVGLAKRIRARAVSMTHKSGASHVGSCLSVADLLAILYGRFLNINSKEPLARTRDRLVFSKGHACAALYAVLVEMGFFPEHWLDLFYCDGGRLYGHATNNGIPGIEVSTGSLGHGLSIACGFAIAGKRDHSPHNVVAVLSDGELDEGSTWEGAMFASHHRLDNLMAIIDYNKMQAMGTVKQVLDLEPLADKWKAFGWNVKQIDGHNLDEIDTALSGASDVSSQPTCIIAHTIKGKGVSFMENSLLWHYRSPDEQDMELALKELAL